MAYQYKLPYTENGSLIYGAGYDPSLHPEIEAEDIDRRLNEEYQSIEESLDPEVD